MVSYAVAFIAAAVTALLLTPFLRRWAHRAGWLDIPSARGGHSRAVPRVGGVVLVLSVALSLAVAVPVASAAADAGVLWPAVTGDLIVFALGLRDDWRPIRPISKLFVQTLAALVVVASGTIVERVTLFGVPHELGLFAVPLTLLWIVGLTNAFNLLDGLDGLVPGLAAIAAATCSAVLFMRGHLFEALLLAALAGALAGFLVFNFHPASIFLGDSGSLTVGFVLAVTAITGWQKGTTVLATAVPLLIFALPIADTSMTIVRRWFGMGQGDVPVSGLAQRVAQLFDADRRHVHHGLLRAGLSPRGAALLLYVVAVGLSAIALVTANLPWTLPPGPVP